MTALDKQKNITLLIYNLFDVEKDRTVT